MELTALLDVPLALPSAPRVVALLQTELLAREPDLRKLCQLVGTDPALILAAARAVLSGAESWGDDGGARLYGDGAASPRIVKACADFLRGRDA